MVHCCDQLAVYATMILVLPTPRKPPDHCTCIGNCMQAPLQQYLASVNVGHDTNVAVLLQGHHTGLSDCTCRGGACEGLYQRLAACSSRHHTTRRDDKGELGRVPHPHPCQRRKQSCSYCRERVPAGWLPAGEGPASTIVPGMGVRCRLRGPPASPCERLNQAAHQHRGFGSSKGRRGSHRCDASGQRSSAGHRGHRAALLGGRRGASAQTGSSKGGHLVRLDLRYSFSHSQAGIRPCHCVAFREARVFCGMGANTEGPNTKDDDDLHSNDIQRSWLVSCLKTALRALWPPPQGGDCNCRGWPWGWPKKWGQRRSALNGQPARREHDFVTSTRPYSTEGRFMAPRYGSIRCAWSPAGVFFGGAWAPLKR